MNSTTTDKRRQQQQPTSSSSFRSFLRAAVVVVLVLAASSTRSSPFLHVNAETLSSGQDVDSYVQNKINSFDVMVFAKSYCAYYY